MKEVRGKCLLAIVLVVLLLLQSFGPLVYSANADSLVQIQLNDELFNAVINSLRAQNIQAYYNADKLLMISESNLEKVTYLDLSNSSISDLTGLSSFKYVTNLNLTANELTVDSNLSELDSLPLEKLNLSSNKLESVSTITTFDSIAETDITNQEVTKTEIISVDVSEESSQSKTYTISLPDILLKDTGSLDADWLDAEVDGGCSINWATVNGSTVTINVAKGTGESYQALKGLLRVLVNVNDSASKLANTKMTLNYVIIDSTETGIIFEDENLYKAVKAQLTAGQTENSALDSYGSSGETLYSRAYDDILILVIDNNTLFNKIPSLILNDKKVSNLTGLQEFVGLDTDLDLSYNYIESIDRIIELAENKETRETELQENYSNLLSTLSSYRNSLTTAIKDEDESKISMYRDYIEETLEELYKTYEKEYLLTTLLTSNTYSLTYSDIYTSDKSTAESYANEIMNKIANLESEGCLSDWETELIIKAFDIPTTSTTDDDEESEATEIENPISAYFDSIKDASETNTVSIYRNFIDKIKTLDAIVVAGNYCLNERLYGGEDACVLEEGFDKLVSDLYSLGFDTYYAQLAKLSYTTYTSGCMCDIIDSESEVADIVPGKYDNAQDMVSLLVKLPKLKKLNLEDNSIESVDGIEILKEIETLNLYKNLLDDITSVEWASFTNLKNLNLGYNQLSDVNCLQVITSLETLDLTKNLLSGSFSFSLVGMPNLVSADFSYNQISDIAYFTNQFKFLAKSVGMEVEDYVMSSYCPTVKFQYQTLTLKTTVTSESSFITVNLPSIFEQAEKIDYSRTSFGIDSLLGTVEGDGTTVKLYTPSNGMRTAVVTIEGYNGTGYSEDGIAYGTKCTIEYDVIKVEIDNPDTEEPENPDVDNPDTEEPENPDVDNPDTEEPENPDVDNPDTEEPENPDVDNPDTEEPENPDVDNPDTEDPDIEDPSDDDFDIEYGYKVEDKYVYVNTPKISLTTFAKNLVVSASEEYTITVKNSDTAISDNIATGAVVSIDTPDGEEIEIFEVVVLGDINGDGEVNALDSGMIRNAIKGRTTLIGVFEAAADVEMDGDIDSSDALKILQYRADKILSF